MGTIYLALAFHNHQPVGNFDWVFEEAYRRAYEPLIAALERHPGVRVALHYTGPLRDWLQAHRPDFFPRIRRLVERGQVELMAGAYYEPILAVIPEADQAGQIRKHIEAIRADFGFEPTGFWLAERVWEPHLPRALAPHGLRYTIVDDTHFKWVGLGDEDLFGYYVTEDLGYPLKIFGTSKHLRYTIPWAPVEEVIAWLREQAERPLPPGAPPRVAVMGDDGEKFGLWPGTDVHCWERGWMEDFFSALEANADWLITLPPGEYAARFPPLGRIYLPTASYDEMSEWALPAEASADLTALQQALQREGRPDVLRFVRGGFWRVFLAKYPEVNQMHKKMLWVSRKAHAIADPERRAEALDHLWAGQCNCPYWHGVFGGVYLFHIREANYQHLIAAEALADEDRYGEGPWAYGERADFDADTQEETILATPHQWLLVRPHQGGQLVEWDRRDVALNLLNVMTRRREGYHRVLLEAAARGEITLAGREGRLESIHTHRVRVKEPGLEERLVTDWYPRAGLVDHFMAPETSLEAFAGARYPEWGDFINQPYTVLAWTTDPHPVLTLRRDGHLWGPEGPQPLRLEKTLEVLPDRPILMVTYRLTPTGLAPIRVRFGVETNWGLSGGDSEKAYTVWPGGELRPFATLEALPESDEVALVHEWWGRVLIRLSRPAAWWQFPLEAVANSEAGFERVYEGTSLTAHWLLTLSPGETWTVRLSFELA
ncbi:MAG: alpha-amylase [Thermoflexus sp.]|uniref:alpha-amylase/4-alpha-glucanotransferase domain-containing protein n=1 Tax=Thermoflexus sp. TaxID=1969742 RepID=UPI00331F3693